MRFYVSIHLVVTMLVAVIGGCAPPPAPEAPIVVPSGVQFTAVFPRARTVAIAGDFNAWSIAAHPMRPLGSDGLWRAVVPLPPGEYGFMYVVDGIRWLTPPLADDFVDDGFGNRNGIVVVK